MNFNLYKHGISTFSTTPSGDAGLAINNNFTTIADYLDGVALLVGANFSGNISAPKIGVGTTSPSYAIDVRVSASGYISNTCSLSTGVAAIKAVNDVNNVQEFGKFGSASAAFGVVGPGDGYAYSDSNALSFGAIGSLMKFGLGSSLTEAMRLNTTGLGVGCTPATKLDVQGVTTIRNAANTLTTTITGNQINAGGTAANVPVTLHAQGTGGLILNDDLPADFAPNMGTYSVDLQMFRFSSRSMTAGGNYGLIAGGFSNTISSGANICAILGSNSCTISAGASNTVIAAFAATQSVPSFCVTTGSNSAPRTSYAFTQSANDTFATPAQTSVIPMIGTTTDGVTWVTMKAGNSTTIANDNLVTVPANTSMMYSVNIVARSFTNNNLVTAFDVKGCIDNNGTTTSLVGTPTITKWDEATPTGYAVQAIASSGSLSIQVKGIASNTVRWSARLSIVEVSGLTTGSSS